MTLRDATKNENGFGGSYPLAKHPAMLGKSPRSATLFTEEEKNR